MARDDIERFNVMAQRVAATKNAAKRSRLAREVPRDLLHVAAIEHPSPTARRYALFLLDHYANDESTAVFQAALRDPIVQNREMALHGLTCERCRTDDLCLPDVVRDLERLLCEEARPEVRHKAVAVVASFMGRESTAHDLMNRVAASDPDEVVRFAANEALSGRIVRRRRRAARDLKSGRTSSAL